MNRTHIITLVFVTLSLVSSSALAQDPTAGCMPACREGFRCQDGSCVSPCNPTCPAGEICTTNGLCLPETPPAAPPVAIVVGSTRSQPYDRTWQGSSRNTVMDVEYGGWTASDIETYGDQSSRIGGGAFMIVFGSLGMIASGVLGGVASSGTMGADDTTALWLVAAGVDLVSIALFIPGIALATKGSVIRGRLERAHGGPPPGYAALPERPRYALAPLAPATTMLPVLHVTF